MFGVVQMRLSGLVVLESALEPAAAVLMLDIRMPDLVHDGVEAVVFVGFVLDDAGRAVGLLQAVAALDFVAVALLVVLLFVAGVRVVDRVVKRVLGVRLHTSAARLV